MKDPNLAARLSRCISMMNETKNSDRLVFDRFEHMFEHLTRSAMPSGSGIDNGCKFDLEKCKPDKLVFQCDFHHMDENGFYDGWTGHRVIAKPGFDDISVNVMGTNKNNIKEYLGDVLFEALNAEIPQGEWNRVWNEYQTMVDNTTKTGKITAS